MLTPRQTEHRLLFCERDPKLKDLLVKHRPKRQGKRTDLVDNINEVGIGEFAVSYDQCIKLCERKPGVKDLLTKHRPAGKRGGDRKSETAKIKRDNVTLDPIERGNSRAYLEGKLAKDNPAIWQAYLNNEYRSARAAAIAAGFVKNANDAQDHPGSTRRHRVEG